MQILLGTTAQNIRGDRSLPVIQNLGPGTVYLDTDGDVDATSGLKIDPGAVYEFPISGGNMGIWIVASEANTDVRVIELG